MNDMKNIILVGDIGGTNCRLELIKNQAGPSGSDSIPVVFKRENYKSANFSIFLEVLKEFLKDISEENYPDQAVFGTPGQVIDGELRMKNFKWPVINIDDYTSKLNLKKITFLNDCVAIGHGIIGLSETDVININPHASKSLNKVKAALIPGTGVGESMMIPIEKEGGTQYYIFPNEGAHSNFGAVSELQSEYLEYYKKLKNIDFVSVENMFAGPAISRIYDFLSTKHKITDKEIHLDENTLPLPEAILTHGLNHKESISRQVLNLFIELYAVEVSNMSLRTLCFSGIYLGGSITTTIMDYLIENKDIFLNIFYKNHDVLCQILRQIPVYLVKKDDLGIFGVEVYLKKLI